jgi:hypothetical protein
VAAVSSRRIEDSGLQELETNVRESGPVETNRKRGPRLLVSTEDVKFREGLKFRITYHGWSCNGVFYTSGRQSEVSETILRGMYEETNKLRGL